MTGPDEEVNQRDADAQAIELSGAMMAHLAGNMSEKFDTFATWLLAGFGAAVALLLTSHEVSGLVAAPTIRYGAKLFLSAVGVAVLQKYISIIVTGGSEGGDFARTAMKDHFKARHEMGLGININFPLFMREFLRPIFKPALWIASSPLRKIAAGDVNAANRRLVVMMQIQGVLVIVEVILFIAAMWRIVAALPIK